MERPYTVEEFERAINKEDRINIICNHCRKVWKFGEYNPAEGVLCDGRMVARRADFYNTSHNTFAYVNVCECGEVIQMFIIHEDTWIDFKSLTSIETSKE